jgi:hypothetical protein
VLKPCGAKKQVGNGTWGASYGRKTEKEPKQRRNYVTKGNGAETKKEPGAF